MSYFDESYTLEAFRQLLSVDSTTGQYREIQEKAAELIRALGFEPSAAGIPSTASRRTCGYTPAAEKS